MDKLHVAGNQLQNNLGQEIILRGVFKAEFTDSCTGWFPPAGKGIGDGYNIWDEQAVRDTFAEMKRWGINLVCWHLYVDWWKNNKSTTIAAGVSTNRPYRDCLHDMLNIAEEYGIYCVLGWYAVKTGTDEDPLPYPPTSYDPEGTVIASKEEFIAFSLQAIEELSTHNNAMFKIWDEPVSSGAAFTEWFTVCKNIIDQTRAKGITNIIAVHYGYAWSINWLNDAAVLPLWQDGYATTNNIMFTGHIYRAHGTFSGRTGLPNNAYLYDDVKAYLESHGYRHFKQDMNLCVLVYAIGAWLGETDDQERECFKNSLAVLNEWGINWCVWQWQRADGAWSIQIDGAVPLLPNKVGQIVIAAIGGTTPPEQYTTPFEFESENGKTYELTAPSTVTQGTATYTFNRFMVNGVEQTLNPLTFTVHGDVQIVAEYETTAPPEDGGGEVIQIGAVALIALAVIVIGLAGWAMSRKGGSKQ